MDFETIAENLKRDLKDAKVAGQILLDRFAVISDLSRKAPAYLDNRYAPFYYYLGKYYNAINLMEIGFGIGFFSGCYLKSCKTVEDYLAFKPVKEEFFSFRIGKSNIKKVYKGNSDYYYGNLFDQEFSIKSSKKTWDLIFINLETTYDEHLQYLDYVYPLLSNQGLIVVDYLKANSPCHDSFEAFAMSKNRKIEYFNTRYRTGIIQK